MSLAAAAFLLYFGLLLFCDVRRPALDVSLAVTDEGLIVQAVQPGSAAERAGVRPADRVVSLDGRRLEGRLDWLAAELLLPLNRPATVALDRSGHRIEAEITIPPAGAEYWLRREGLVLVLVRGVQTITLAAAIVVWWRRPSDAVGVLGGWLLATTAVFTVVPPYRLAAVWRELPMPLSLIVWGPHLSALSISAVMFSFFAVFPRRWLRRPSAWLLAWTPMGLAVAWHVHFVFDLLHGPDVHWNRPLGAAAILPVSAGYVAAGLGLLARGYATLEDEIERRRTRVVVASSIFAWIVGVSVVVGYWARPRFEITESMFASPIFALGTVTSLLFPLGFAYAILRHRLFDVPAIVRQGLQYALARRALVSLVPLTMAALAVDVLIHRSEPIGAILARRGWLYAALMLLAVVARLRRDAWLDALDRRFFRERYSAHRLLREVAADIRRAGAFEPAATDVIARIEAAVHPTAVAVLMRRVGGRATEMVAARPSTLHVPPLAPDNPLLDITRAISKPLDLAPGTHGVAQDLPDEARRWLAVSGVELIVPIALSAAGPDALLVLGARRSEEPYDADDKELLQAIADSLALVLGGSGEGDREGPMMECPDCGRCEPPDTIRCPVDGAAMISARIPRRFGPRYLMERRLARGGMGTVYEALDTQLGRRVAIKVLRDELVASPEALSAFEREARLVAGLNHPNVVVVHDFGSIGGCAFLVMERLEGCTLRDRLTHGDPPGPGEVSAMVRGIATALEATHGRGIVHRDLKPENVFVVQVGTTRLPKVLDFGIARLVNRGGSEGRGRLTRAGALFGTPEYMAPEQEAGGPPSPAWDLWALAVLAYEMVTGRLPGDDPGDGLRPPLDAFFRRALSPDASLRPPAAKQLASELEQALAAVHMPAES